MSASRRRRNDRVRSPAEQAMLDAATIGDARKVRELLGQGVSANVYDGYGEPAAQLAARFARAEALRALLEGGADVRDIGPIGQTLLHCMAPYAPMHVLLDDVIARGGDIEARNDVGQTPIMTAALNGSVVGVEALMARGADPRVRDTRGSNLLLALVGRGRDADGMQRLLRQLLGLGLDPLQCGEFGESAITRAAREGLRSELALFGEFVDVAGARNAHGEHVAEIAAFHGHAEAARELLHRGAPSDLLCAASLGDMVQMQRLLVADPSALDRVQGDAWHRSTPLAGALRHGHAEAALWLLAQGADANGACPEISMLHAAIRHCPDERVIAALIDQGANLEAADGDNNTPLNFAARADQVRIAELLLQAGANALAETERGYTAAEFATSDTMRALLARHGCRRRS